jgi:hypothetical protein
VKKYVNLGFETSRQIGPGNARLNPKPHLKANGGDDEYGGLKDPVDELTRHQRQKERLDV